MVHEATHELVTVVYFLSTFVNIITLRVQMVGFVSIRACFAVDTELRIVHP